MKTLRVAFRVDSSVEMGTGHVMRCLTLADALKAKGAHCHFICREHPGNLIEQVRSKGYTAHILPMYTAADTDLAHSQWLGDTQKQDAEACAQFLANLHPDWLIVDHYSLDIRWERALAPHYNKLMVIDDLADRPHDCDLLLDQNLGRNVQDYCELLRADTTALIGPHYALLRPDFAALRPQSLARRARNPQLKRLLITMGGVDKNNTTGKVLDVLKAYPLPQELHITVVIGAHALWLTSVQAQALNMPRPTKVLAGVSNMAQLMADSDLAIGAAGGTAWERCCLGLPSLLLVQAENQQAGATALQNAGAAIVLKICNQISVVLRELLLVDSINASLLKMVQAAGAVTDGTGCEKITQQLVNNHA